MVELRWVRQGDATRLQYRLMCYPMRLATGEVVVCESPYAVWIDVPTEKEETDG